jgi:glycosyltransferase involved in cell wall biosynthesis
VNVLMANKFHYHRGGAEAVYLAESELLRSRGHEVVPFSMHHPENLPSEYARYFVSNVELREDRGGPLGALAAAGRILYSREAAAHVERLARDTRPDVAHVHNVYHQLSPSIIRALRGAGVPVVMTLHDYKLICPSYTLTANGSICERCRGHRYYNPVLQGCIKGSRLKGALCGVEAALHSVMGLYRDGVTFYLAPSRFMRDKVVEFGIDPARVEYVPNFIAAPPEPATTPVGTRVLYAGRLERVKGVRTMLAAWRRAKAAGTAELWIAGDGEDRAELESYCSAQRLTGVRFLGHLDRDDLTSALDAARVVVVPSEWYENAPLAVLEAAARAKPIVASDIGGLPELVRDGDTGRLFPAGDAGALAERIDELALDGERAQAMGRRARDFVLGEFSAGRHYDDLMNVYGRATSSRLEQRKTS